MDSFFLRDNYTYYYEKNIILRRDNYGKNIKQGKYQKDL